jgi:hypothetical protein
LSLAFLEEQTMKRSRFREEQVIAVPREHATVVYTPNAAWLVRQDQFDGGPFKIVEFVAYNSRLQFERLRHAHSRIINPQRPVAWSQTF